MTIEVKYDLKIEDEDLPIDGAFSSGDDAVDEALVKEIRDRLERGDLWAWCQVIVTASVEVDGETFDGEGALGGCCYRDEAEFIQPGGYYDDMKVRALDDLLGTLNVATRRGALATEALTALCQKAP